MQTRRQIRTMHPVGSGEQASGQLALHPCTSQFILMNLLVAQRLAFGNHLFAFIVQHRLPGMKRMQFARRNVFLPCQHFCLHGLGHFGAQAIDLNQALFDATPNLTLGNSCAILSVDSI